MRLALLLILALGQASPAMADGKPLVVGLYSPWTYFPDSLSRSQYAMEVAGALSRSTGLKVEGRGFIAREVFDAQVESGQLAFAIIDAQHQIERGFTPLAQAIAHGRPSRPMVLAVRDTLTGQLMAQRGRTLAQVVHGPWDTRFVVNFLLRNQVSPDFFVGGRRVRDVGSALSLVKLGQVDAAFTYKGTHGGIYESPPVPLPAFVQTDPRLSAQTVTTVRRAVLGVAVRNEVFGGFSAYRHEIYKGLEAALATAPRDALRPPTARGPRKQPIQRSPYKLAPQKHQDARMSEALGVPIQPPAGRY